MLETTCDIPGAVPLSQSAGIALRGLRRTDLPKLAWWYNRCVPRALRYRRYRSAADMEARLFKTSGRYSRHFAILSNGRLKGYCGWNDHQEVFIFIGHEFWRRQGLGTKAMRHLMQEFKAAGHWAMRAKTDRADFWLKLGFIEQPNYHSLTEADKARGLTMLVWNWRTNGSA